MPSLSTLLRKLETLHRQHIEIEHQIAKVEREIVTASKSERPRRKRAKQAPVAEVIRVTVKVLCDAGKPLQRQEIAARLDISVNAAAYRLQRAVAAGFVEGLGDGRYRVAKDVPAL